MAIDVGHQGLTRMIGDGLTAGTVERTASIGWEWNIAGRCQRPNYVELVSRPYVDRPGAGFSHAVYIDLWCRCRKCPACLRERRGLWARRAVSELERAERTWFVTLTLNPSEHYRMLARAIARNKTRGTEWGTLTEAEQFQERHLESGKEIVKYLKRLRQACGAKFRYLCVVEAHKTGLPHYHLLLHEVPGEASLRHRELSAQWRLGFGKWMLSRTGPKAAWYVAKYLAKSARARVRASQRYGSPVDRGYPDNVESLVFPKPRTFEQKVQSRPTFPWEANGGVPQGRCPLKDDAGCPTAISLLIGQALLPTGVARLSRAPPLVPVEQPPQC